MKTALPRPPLGLTVQVGWDFCLKGSIRKAARSRPQALHVGWPQLGHALAPHGDHFPFPREKGSEKGSWQSVPGVAREPDFLRKSG